MEERRDPGGFDSLWALAALVTIWIAALALRGVPPAVQAASIPAEVGEPVLIIDPGHGGLDGGASTADGNPESAYNLQIALCLRDLGGFLAIPTVMTRSSDELDYPPTLHSIAEKKRWDTRRRTDLINSTEHGFLLSIHQNFYPDIRPHGAQILYAQGEPSRLWGEKAQALLKTKLEPDNQRSAIPAGREIYIMSHVHCPAILAECGFLSHPQEAARLGEPIYQLKLAVLLAESFLEFTKESNI